MRDISDKRVLITGGCGSIGSTLTRLLVSDSNPDLIRVLDNNEKQVHELKLELGAQHEELEYLVGDIRDEVQIGRFLTDIDVVFHVAALKHVSLVEKSPYQAVQTNVGGTRNVVQAAVQNGVESVVFVSTDKAANPSSAMGATKQLGERVVVAANETSNVCFSCVRFGNVVGTRGSVVPVFLNQIRRGGPLTVTDPEMTRFVMLPSDASKFVRDTYRRMEGGEVFVRKMPAVRIGDLAQAMRSRYAPKFGRSESEIEIEVTGARPGERHHEKLVASEEARSTVEKDRTFVIYPNPKLATNPPASFNNHIDGEFTSEDADKLSNPQIVELIENTTDIKDNR